MKITERNPEMHSFWKGRWLDIRARDVKKSHRVPKETAVYYSKEIVDECLEDQPLPLQAEMEDSALFAEPDLL